MLFVTFHKAVSNVYAYEDNGTLLNPKTPNVLNSPDNKLDELRGIYFINNYLYVINGGKDVSNILCFQGSGTSFTCAGTLYWNGGAAHRRRPRRAPMGSDGTRRRRSSRHRIDTPLRTATGGSG